MGYTRYRQQRAGNQRMPSVKNSGKPYAGKLHVRFDEGGQAKACSLLYPVCRRFAVPCVAQLVRRLRDSRYALRQSSPPPPDQPALLGGAQGMKIKKLKPKKRVGNKLPTILNWIGKTI